MIYVFEGVRNSGKTYLSNHIADEFGIERFQFNFGSYFNLLDLESKDNREAHSFSMGKELMLMQLSKDLSNKSIGNFIHDRGILTVLSWGLSENRISKDDVIKQLEFIRDNELLSGITIIHIRGNNPNTGDRNKDQWDYADNSDFESIAFDYVKVKLIEICNPEIHTFQNAFDVESTSSIDLLFKTIIHN
jgi:hypothetical protein